MKIFGFAQFHRIAPIGAALIALLLVPAAIAIEKAEPSVWGNRLILPFFSPEENLHTPRESAGLFLPPTISTSRVIEAEDSPVILAGTTTIPAGVTLTLNPGVEIFSHEYGSLAVNGTLIVNGSEDRGVTFTTNELHPSNQTWSGIIFGATGHGTIQQAHIKFASPAITCGAGSAVVIQDTIIELGSTGVFSQSPNCSISQSIIRNVDVGVISFQKSAALFKTIITARDSESRVIQSTSLPVTR